MDERTDERKKDVYSYRLDPGGTLAEASRTLVGPGKTLAIPSKNYDKNT